MPFYDDEFPPCDGLPGPDELDPEKQDRKFWKVGCVPRELRAAHVFCDRISPLPNGCAEYMAGAVAESLARAERKKFQMASPFGYDYYLSFGMLRDADNDTVVATYLNAGAGAEAFF